MQLIKCREKIGTKCNQFLPKQRKDKAANVRGKFANLLL